MVLISDLKAPRLGARPVAERRSDDPVAGGGGDSDAICWLLSEPPPSESELLENLSSRVWGLLAYFSW